MEQNKKSHISLYQIIGVIIIVFSIYGLGGYFMWDHYFRHNPGWAGTFGDMFGVITSFFSATTVILVFYAARLQKEELDATREELKKQVESSQHLSETASKQNLNLILQRFEATLFALIEIYNSNVSIFYSGGKTGKEAFNYELSAVEARLRNEYGYTIEYEDGSHDLFAKKYNEPSSIGGYDGSSHYYRHIANIILFIKKSAISTESKHFYARIFTSLLSKYELMLFFYYIGLSQKIRDGKEIRTFCIESEVFADLDLPTDRYKKMLHR